MQFRKHLGLILCVATILLPLILVAAGPRLLNYQGQLTNGLGAPISGAVSVQFSIYGAPSGGTAVWTETQSVTVSNGQFGVLLGSSTPLVDSVFKDSSRYLGIKVGADPELTPRVRLVSVPWAYRVSSIDGATGHSLQLIGNANDTLQLSAASSVILRATDAAGDERVALETSPNGDGKLILRSASGNRIEFGGDTSLITAYDPVGQARFKLNLSTQYVDGGGAISFFRHTSTGSTGMTSPDAGEPISLVFIGQSSNYTGKISTFDTLGRELTRISSTLDSVTPGSGAIRTMHPNGSTLVQITTALDGPGYIRVNDTLGKAHIRLGQLSGFQKNGFIAVADSTENQRVAAFVDAGHDGHIDLYNNNNAKRVQITSTGESATVDGGILILYGFNNKELVRLSHVAGNGNLGMIEVKDTLGTAQCGMYVNATNNGIVWGDTKSFRVPNPLKSGTDLWYTSIEGPEAAIYVRGTATLHNGVAEVLLPDYFSVLASANSMTVQLTPLSSSSEGLAVTQKSPDRIFVEELRHGQGNYQFDYEVKAVRIGHEDYDVVRPSDFVKSAGVSALKSSIAVQAPETVSGSEQK